MARVSCILASCVLIALLLAVPAAAYPSPSNYDEGSYEPEEIMNMLDRLENLVRMERKMNRMENYRDDISSAKRGLDLGLTRGYSGALQGKHLVGVAAANYAGGPGRRRRDTAH